MGRGRWTAAVAVAVAVRPWLWSTAAVQLVVLARPGWWRRWPPLPTPDPAYLRFRLLTQYGSADRRADPADVIEYLRWRRSYGRVLR